MCLLAIDKAHHLIFDLYCERELKGFLLAILKNQDTKGGCYIYLKGKTVVYVGKSDALFSRLTQHKNAKNGFENTCDDWTDIGVIFSDNPILTERELIRQFQPQYNKLGNENQY